MTLAIALTTPTKIVLGADKRISTIKIPFGIRGLSERYAKVLDYRDDAVKIIPIEKHVAILTAGQQNFGEIKIKSLINEYANNQKYLDVISVANGLHAFLQERIRDSGEEIVEDSPLQSCKEIVIGYDQHSDSFPKRYILTTPGQVSEDKVNSERASLYGIGCTNLIHRMFMGLDHNLEQRLEDEDNGQNELGRIIHDLNKYKYIFRNGELTIDAATSFVAELIKLTSLTEQLLIRPIDHVANPSGVSQTYDIAIIEPTRGFYWHTLNGVRQETLLENSYQI